MVSLGEKEFAIMATIRKQTYICEDIQIKVLFQVKVFNWLWYKD